MNTTTTSTTTHPGTVIEADPDLPTVKIIREFDAPRELVYRAHTDPALVAQWMGPRSIDMDIEVWDVRTCGEYRDARRRGDRPLLRHLPPGGGEREDRADLRVRGDA